MSHADLQKPLLELINRLVGLVGGMFAAGPGTHGQHNVVTLAAGQYAEYLAEPPHGEVFAFRRDEVMIAH